MFDELIGDVAAAKRELAALETEDDSLAYRISQARVAVIEAEQNLRAAIDRRIEAING